MRISQLKTGNSSWLLLIKLLVLLLKGKETAHMDTYYRRKETKAFYFYSARECIAAVDKRLNNKNPNVQLYAVAVSLSFFLLLSIVYFNTNNFCNS